MHWEEIFASASKGAAEPLEVAHEHRASQLS